MEISLYAAPGCAMMQRRAKESFNSDRKKSDYDLFESICGITGHDPVVVMKNNKKRKREIVVIRQVSMAALYLVQKRSLSYSGGYFFKNHATVYHSIKTVKALLDTDPLFSKMYSDIFKGVKWPVFK